ncbi:MAG TPA: hypothetical protein VFZ86_15690 [Thermoleophilia bacterium]|nr:hypothetical protein [Thermoleophilia bacterium]
MTGRLHSHKATAAAMLLALLAVLALLGVLALAPPVRAATGGAAGPQQSVGNIVEVDQDVTVPSGTTADNVFVVGGSLTIAGTVRNVVAGIGADVRLLPSARVGTAGGAGDTSLVVVGGTLTSAPGAAVVGDTTYEPLSAVRDVFTSGFWEPITTPFAGLSLIGWAGSTVLLVLLGLLAAAVLPRQTRASEERIAGHFWSSLGWGALTALVIVPLITLALVVTIIGILVAIPWLFAAVALFLFGYLAFGAFFGRSLLRLVGYRGDSLMLAVTVGVIASQLVRLIPYVGAPIVFVMWTIGGGGAIAAFFVWRRSRRAGAVPTQGAEEEQKLRVAA